MRNLRLSIGVFMLIFSGNILLAQDLNREEVPANILEHFDLEYAQASDVEWEMKGDRYKVEFEYDRQTDMEIWYDANGNVVREKEEWKKSKLPDAVKNAIKEEYSDYKIDDVDKITEDGKVHFKVSLDSNRDEDMEVWIDESGEVTESKRD